MSLCHGGNLIDGTQLGQDVPDRTVTAQRGRDGLAALEREAIEGGLQVGTRAEDVIARLAPAEERQAQA
jgi:hypothetical protein